MLTKVLKEKDSLEINDNFLKQNNIILQEKIKLWENFSDLKFDEFGRCEFAFEDNNKLCEFYKEQIEMELDISNDLVAKYFEKSINFFTNNIDSYTIIVKINDENITYYNSFLLYQNLKYILLENSIITLNYNLPLEKKYKILFGKKFKEVKKEIKISKILNKMNDLMLEGEKEYFILSKEKKERKRNKIDIERDLKLYKRHNPYWTQQQYLPCKNKNIIISVNPIDIFTCIGNPAEIDLEEKFFLTKFSSCYSSSMELKNNTLFIEKKREFSSPNTLYEINSLLSKAIAFIPNGNTFEYKNNTFYGMIGRSHIYLKSTNQIFCDKCYPNEGFQFKHFLENVCSNILFFDVESLNYYYEDKNLSNNDLYVVSDFQESRISNLKNCNIHLDGIGLFFENNRYCFFKEKGDNYRPDNKNQPCICCENCGNDVNLPFLENDDSIDLEEVENLYCTSCIEDMTCFHCKEIEDDNLESIDDVLVCNCCKENLYVECLDCDSLILKSKATYLCEDCSNKSL